MEKLQMEVLDCLPMFIITLIILVLLGMSLQRVISRYRKIQKIYDRTQRVVRNICASNCSYSFKTD